MKSKKEVNTKANNDLAIQVIDFSKKYSGRGKYAVEKANFEVRKGEFHGFIGANGAGKTTTIKSLIGAYGRFEGQINIFGHKNNTLEAKAKIGYIPESAKFPKTLNTYQYIYYMANLGGLEMKEAKKFAKKALADVGLSNLAKKNPNTFSSGQKKKVLLAQALVNNPEILIMDEPAANLDPQARYDFFETLKKLKNEGKAIFISSHILSELGQYIDSLTILDGGKVVYTGSINDVTKNNEFDYKFAFKNNEDDKTFREWLSAQKLKVKVVDNGISTVDFKDEATVQKALTFITKNKLAVLDFGVYIITLEQVYEKFVQYGSVDTKGQDVKSRKKVKNV